MHGGPQNTAAKAPHMPSSRSEGYLIFPALIDSDFATSATSWHFGRFMLSNVAADVFPQELGELQQTRVRLHVCVCHFILSTIRKHAPSALFSSSFSSKRISRSSCLASSFFWAYELLAPSLRENQRRADSSLQACCFASNFAQAWASVAEQTCPVLGLILHLQ